ncbi:MAG TPA: nuclear transport factor 2 family protein [Steroidobacteraceae bacterium]|jgi:ketosteroid isomerase-like protein
MKYTILSLLTISAAFQMGSFAHAASLEGEAQEIRAILVDNAHAYTMRDKEKICEMYRRAGERLLIFDMVPPVEDRGFQKAVVEKVSRFVDGTKGPIVSVYGDPQIHVIDHNHAYVTSHVQFAFTTLAGKNANVAGRATQIFERIDGTWTVVHEHSSVPSVVGFSWSGT